jgi:RimJ/RimL family protein N-acetyltransferase
MRTLQTDRLILRPFTVDDFDDVAAMFANPEVMEFIAVDGKPMPGFGAWQSLCATVGHWELRGYGQFAVIERASDEFVGRIGPWLPEDWPGLELGWLLTRRSWGKGYATEAAAVCLDYIFSELNQPQVISLIRPGNVRSIRVAERLGMQLTGEVRLNHVPELPVLQYALRRDGA